MTRNNHNLSIWSKMGPRAMFGQFMLDLVKKDKKIILLSADLGRSSGLDRFKNEFPNNYISVGISEQNLIGVASGLASRNFKVFVTSFAPFLSMRASEQIRMNLGYMKHQVNLVALGSGVSMGFLGNSHFGLEDISIMRAIPGLNISSPSDCLELNKILNDYCQNNRGPSYIRLTGVPGYPKVYEKDYNYKFGKISKINKGKDLLIISTGSMVTQSIKANEILKKKGINASIFNIHTLNPIDESLKSYLKKYQYIVTVEEHSKIGGLNSIISEIIQENNLQKKLLSISIPPRFISNGSYSHLLNKYGLVAEKISTKIRKFIGV